MKTRFLLLSVFLATVSQANASVVSLSECFEFFYVKRPVALGAVEHEFVAVENIQTQQAKAFGLLKGNEDLNLFVAARKGSEVGAIKLASLGSVCGLRAQQALQVARDYSKAWTEYYKNWALYLMRMGVTPVMGKPCRNTALALSELLAPYLTVSDLE